MALSFGQLRNLQLGGLQDTAALLGVAAGAMATHPALAPSPYALAAMLGMGASALGGGWLGRRWSDALAFDALEGGTLRINSSRPPAPTPDGMHLGYIVDTGEPLVIPMNAWMRHAMIVGQSGVGKTVLGSWIMYQQIARGGGMLWIDGKLDPGNAAMLRAMCAWAGRQDDLLIVSPGEPHASNTYNPILFGDADEVASRCLSLIPASEDNAGADHYRQSANQALTTLFNAIQSCGLAYNFADMNVLLMNAEAMHWLEQRVPYGTEAQKQLSLFIHNYKKPMRGPGGGGVEMIDPERLKTTLGGIAGRLFTFGSGKVGQVTNTYNPEVRLKEDVLANRIIYVALPTMGKAEMASNFGKMMIGDLRSSIAQIQSLPEAQRPSPPFLSFFDECGSYVTNSWGRMFEQSRSASMMMTPAFQTRANLEVLGEELRAMVSGNTLTKMFFKPGEFDTANWMADLIGEERQRVHSISANRGTGRSKVAHVAASPGGSTEAGAQAFSESTQNDYKITGSELMKLGQGEAIVTFDGHNVYHIRIPMVRVTGDAWAEAEATGINRRRVRRVKGLSLTDDIERWIGGGRKDQLQ